MIGNDIVDLDFFEEPAYSHVWYLRRVCTSAEQKAVGQSSDPARALAVLWAAKEAAYKSLSKQRMGCHFIPRDFAVEIEGRDPARIDKKLSILYAEMQCHAFIFQTDRWVHAIAISGHERMRWTVRGNPHFAPGFHGAERESDAVRALGKTLLDTLSMDGAALTFEGRIPRVRRNNTHAAGVDVSLSHHGAFVAAAMAWPAGLGDRQVPMAAPPPDGWEDSCCICTV